MFNGHRGHLPVRALTTIAVVAALTAGCSHGAGTGPGASPGPGASSAPRPPAAPDALVLQLREPPGLLPPGGAAATIPTFSLYADGRLVTAAATGDPNTWPTLTEHRVAAADIRQLLGQAAADGLLAPRSGAAAGPDAPVTVVTVATADRRYTGTLARTDPALAPLRADLTRYAAGSGSPYRPATVAVIATANADPTAPVRPWPLDQFDGQTLTGTGTGSRCVLLRGTAIDTVKQAAATATPTTSWRGGDRLWTVFFRPLLPDEADCGSL